MQQPTIAPDADLLRRDAIRGSRRRLRRLTWITAIAAVVLAVALPAVGRLLDLIKVADQPLGFYLQAQGAIVLLAALLVGFASRARREELRAAAHDTNRTGA